MKWLTNLFRSKKMSFLSIIKTVAALMPLILQMVKSVEEAIPEGGKGKEKLQFVHDVIKEAYPDVEKIWGLVEKIIGLVVGLYKSTGVFQDKPKDDVQG